MERWNFPWRRRRVFSLSLSTLRSIFPSASGLCFTKNSFMRRSTRALRLDKDEMFHPPKGGWGDRTYDVLQHTTGTDIGERSTETGKEGRGKRTEERTSSPTPSPSPASNNNQKRKRQESPLNKEQEEKSQAQGQTQSGESLSKKSREAGNESYREAFSPGKSSGQVSSLLVRASDSFKEALQAASDEDERCSAIKNLGLSTWKLAVHYHKTSSVHYSTTSALFNDAFLSLCRAAEMGEGIKRGPPWIQRVKENLDEAISDFFEFIMSEFSDYDARAKFLCTAVEQVTLDVYQGKIHFELASTYFKSGIVELSDGDLCGYAKALKVFRDCYHPIEETKRLTGKHPTWDLREELESLEEDVFLNTCFAESLQAMHQAELLLEELLCEEEELNMDGVYRVMDMYREAIVLTRGKAVEYEAMAHSKLGSVYLNVLKQKERAKEYFMHCLHLANSLMPRNFAGDEWFNEASDALKEMQDEEKRREDEQWRKDREPYLKQLEKEMESLNELRSKSAERILLDLPEKFPSKHRTKKEKEEGKKSLDDLKKLDRGEMKKLIQKTILLYHPDHVDKDKYGKKYYVLCEEITKILTAKYESFKG